jgi:UDPglucose 6-dehydrogenase
MNISIIGCGYVGIVTCVGLSRMGHRVLGVESHPERLNALREGRLPLYEPGLEEVFGQEYRSGRLRFTSSISQALRETEVLFICVGTPPKESGEPDLSQIEAVLKEIGAVFPEDAYRVIVNKSTVPVGSADYVSAIITEHLEVRPCEGRSSGPAASRFDVVSNPEFLREGSALQDMFYPDRVVIGAASERAREIMRELYRPLIERKFDPVERLSVPSDAPEWIETDPHSAELIKYAANAFLAMKVSFINEMSAVSECIGADIRQVAKGIGADRRIGRAFLQAGVGWGGSCFRKDLLALSHLAWEHDCETRLLEATLAVNERQRSKVVRLLQRELKLLKGKTIAVLGVAFKPETDDCRDAPALGVIERLLDLGARVRAYDPQARFECPDRETFTRHASAGEALQRADAAVLMTEWDEFRRLDPDEVKEWMKGRLLVDARNLLDEVQWEAAGFHVLGFGR